MDKTFLEVDDRSSALPSFPWIVKQKWNDLLMLHWPVPHSVLEPFVPKRLNIDTYDNTAWISFIPFQVTNMRLRWLPKIPYVHTFTEMNIRTYVTYKGNPGVYFFRLFANKWANVIGPRLLMFLPYDYAKMTLQQNKTLRFSLNDRHATFTCTYSPSPDLFLPSKGSLDEWLLERYCFWLEKGKWLFRGDIHHERWKVTKAEATINEHSLASFLPRSLFEKQPILHFSMVQEVFVRRLKIEK